MLIKLVDGQNSRTFECQHIRKTVLNDSKVQREAGFPSGEGVMVTLSPGGVVLRIPEEGDTIFVMNDQGKTVDTIRWPEKGSET